MELNRKENYEEIFPLNKRKSPQIVYEVHS